MFSSDDEPPDNKRRRPDRDMASRTPDNDREPAPKKRKLVNRLSYIQSQELSLETPQTDATSHKITSRHYSTSDDQEPALATSEKEILSDKTTRKPGRGGRQLEDSSSDSEEDRRRKKIKTAVSRSAFAAPEKKVRSKKTTCKPGGHRGLSTSMPKRRGRPPGELKAGVIPVEFRVLWERSIVQLGINILEAMPSDIDVNKANTGLNWPWGVSFIKKITDCLHCPAFKNNPSMFKYALRYAVAHRCETTLPSIPDDLEDVTMGGIGVLESESDTEDDTPAEPVMVPISQPILETINEALIAVMAYVDEDARDENLIARDKRKLFGEKSMSILRSHLLPNATSSKKRHDETASKKRHHNAADDPITAFLSRRYYPKLPENSSQLGESLIYLDLRSVAQAWDKYAEKNNRKSCNEVLKDVKATLPRSKRSMEELTEMVQKILDSRAQIDTANQKERSGSPVAQDASCEAPGSPAASVTSAGWQSPVEIDAEDPDQRLVHRHHQCRPQINVPLSTTTDKTTSGFNARTRDLDEDSANEADSSLRLQGRRSNSTSVARDLKFDNGRNDTRSVFSNQQPGRKSSSPVDQGASYEAPGSPATSLHTRRSRSSLPEDQASDQESWWEPSPPWGPF